jgi:CheY-like chemotaxis protein
MASRRLNWTHPDLILMDLQMPRMDGLEAARRLRSEPGFEYTPIIAVTALAMPNDRERCLAAGMNEYLTKPVNLKALVKIIQKCLSIKEEKNSPMSTILIVDDDPTARENAGRIARR